MKNLKNISIKFWSVGLVLIGILHLKNPTFFIHVMPPYFPMPATLVALSGIVEIILGIAFWQKKFRYSAAIGIIFMLASYLTVHIYMITGNDMVKSLEPGVTLPIAWLRLPLQFVFMAWIWWLRNVK